VVVHGDRGPRSRLRVRGSHFPCLPSHRRYPDLPIFAAGPEATVQRFVESLEVMCRLVVDVVHGAAADVRAVLFAGPEPFAGRTRGLRARLELILHAHDVCAGLGVDYEHDVGVARRMRNHTSPWPMWAREFGATVTHTDDPGAISCAPLAATVKPAVTDATLAKSAWGQWPEVSGTCSHRHPSSSDAKCAATSSKRSVTSPMSSPRSLPSVRRRSRCARR
jgi:hypothetical protein